MGKIYKKIKKILATSIVVLAGTFFMACGEKSFRVSFNINGGSEIASQEVLENGLVVAPTDPTKANAIFDGWYKDAEFTMPWNFEEDKVTADTIIFAKWIETHDITVPTTSLENDGYILSVVGGGTTITIGGSFELKLELNKNKFFLDNFSLLRNGSSVETPANYTEENGKRIYTYSFDNITENQEFSVLGLVSKYFIADFDMGEGYSVIDISGNRSNIEYGSDYSFKINLLEGYTDSVTTMNVWNGQTKLIPNSSGIYTIENVTNYIHIDINDISKNTYNILYPTSGVATPRFEIIDNIATIQHGEELTFKVKLIEQYSKVPVNELIDIKIAGVSTEAEHTYNTETREFIFTIPADKVKGNIVISLDDSDWEIDTYIVSFPSEMVGYYLSSSYEAIAPGKFEVPYNGEFEFTVSLASDYKYCKTFKVMAGNTNITGGLYDTTTDTLLITNIQKDTEIKIVDLTKNAYSIKVPQNAGYEIELADGYSLPAEQGTNVRFKIKVLEELGYEQTEESLGMLTGKLFYDENPYTSIVDKILPENSGQSIQISKQDGYYQINSIAGNIELNIPGIQKKKFTATVPQIKDGYTIENLPSEFVYGERYTFDVIVDEEYLDSLKNNEVKAYISGKDLSGNRNLAENKITFIINVNADLVSKLGSSKILPIEIVGVAKNYLNLTFNLGTNGGRFENFESLGEGYSETSYVVTIKRGNNDQISEIAPSIANIIAPDHYEINLDNIWNTKGLTNVSDITKDTTFTLNLVPIEYYISFNLNGGVNSNANNMNGGTTNPKYIYSIEHPITLANPTKEITQGSGEYYDFLGWFLEEDGELINIVDFTGYKDITVSAHWGIKVGANESRKTLAEAITLANSGDKIIVLEGATLGKMPTIDSKDLEIVGENENVTIVVENTNNLNGSATYGYSLIFADGSGILKISNIKFEVDESILNNVVLLDQNILSVEINNVETTNLGLVKAVLSQDANLVIDNVSVSYNQDNFAVSIQGSGNGNVVIKNSTFNTFKGVLVEANETYPGTHNITIENNEFNKNALLEENRNAVSVDIKLVGKHNILKFENEHLNTLENAEIVVIEDGFTYSLDKEEIEDLVSKIVVEFKENSNIVPIKLVNTSYDEIVNEILYNTELNKFETILYKGFESNLVNILAFSNIVNVKLEANNALSIFGNVTIPENTIVNVNKDSIIYIESDATLNVNGILTYYGNIYNSGNIIVGTYGEIENKEVIKLGTSYEIGNVTSKQTLELGEENNGTNYGTISGGVVEASKTSLVYEYFKNAVNSTGFFVSFQVYVGVDKANQDINDIKITNENGLLYNNGTHTSNYLTDKVNAYGYIDVIIDANVIDNNANLTKVIIQTSGKTYEISVDVNPYIPEVLADESYAIGYIYGAYPGTSGVVEAYIFNALQTIEENEDSSITSDKDNFYKLVASGSLAKVKENSNLDKIAPTTSSDHFVTFRQYVGLQYAGMEVEENYAINGVESTEQLNLHIFAQQTDGKNKVDAEGYLHYIFDANVTFYGVWFNEKVNVETIQVYFTLDSETYEIRVDIKDMEVYNRTNNMQVMLGNTADVGIENRLNMLAYNEGKYTISGRVFEVGETEEIKNNETFYNSTYTASNYFVSYRIFNLDSENQIKPLIGKNVTFEVSGYAGKTWCNGKVLANGYVEFITELLVSNNEIQNGELTLTYTIEGEEEKTFIIELKDLTIIEDKASKELAIKVEDFEVNGTGTGVNFTNFNITPVDEGSYKVTSDFFTKVAENSNAYNNPYALEDSTGYFVAFIAFAGMRMADDTINVTLTYKKENATVKTETRELKVNVQGYIGIFVDTMTVGEELGLDTLIITLNDVDNETVSYTLDFSEVTVAVYETE